MLNSRPPEALITCGTEFLITCLTTRVERAHKTIHNIIHKRSGGSLLDRASRDAQRASKSMNGRCVVRAEGGLGLVYMGSSNLIRCEFCPFWWSFGPVRVGVYTELGVRSPKARC